MTAQELVFVLLGVVTVGAGVLVVTTRQLVHAALWLVVSFGGLAGSFLLLTAEFVAWVQVLIYIGAVIVLLLFGIMLTRAPIGRSAALDSGNRWAALAVAAATAGVLVTVVVRGFKDAYLPLRVGGGAAGAIGSSVFRGWVLPFEIISVLLLAALIGAIVLSRTDVGPGPGPGPGPGAGPGPGPGAGPGPGPGPGPGDGRPPGPQNDHVEREER
ncbi:MAG TPA: NADH-quinone oxidoreductase subunit J [Streptosporangiaceae bacterium]|nr:NADH-quinone oxidoreductase subunit J [Streptosporangiaceae bacterium]